MASSKTSMTKVLTGVAINMGVVLLALYVKPVLDKAFVKKSPVVAPKAPTA